VKSAGSIRHKISQIRYRHLKKRLEAELRKVPGNCTYNAVIPIPSQMHSEKNVESPSKGDNLGFGICMLGADELDKWKPTFCDDRVDGGLRAKKCSVFCPRHTKEQVKAAFISELQEMTLAEVAYNYPDLAALIWVLDEADLPAMDSAEEEDLGVEPPKNTPEQHLESRVVFFEPTQDFLPEPVSRKTTWWSRLLGVWS